MTTPHTTPLTPIPAWRNGMFRMALHATLMGGRLERLRSRLDVKPSFIAGIGAVFDECMELLDRAPATAIVALRRCVEAGEIDGGECLNCLRGTLARHCGKSYDDFANPRTGGGDWLYLEGFLGDVQMGQTPETSARLRRVIEWIDGYLAGVRETAEESGDTAMLALLDGVLYKRGDPVGEISLALEV